MAESFAFLLSETNFDRRNIRLILADPAPVATAMVRKLRPARSGRPTQHTSPIAIFCCST